MNYFILRCQNLSYDDSGVKKWFLILKAPFDTQTYMNKAGKPARQGFFVL